MPVFTEADMLMLRGDLSGPPVISLSYQGAGPRDRVVDTDVYPCSIAVGQRSDAVIYKNYLIPGIYQWSNRSTADTNDTNRRPNPVPTQATNAKPWQSATAYFTGQRVFTTDKKSVYQARRDFTSGAVEATDLANTTNWSNVSTTAFGGQLRNPIPLAWVTGRAYVMSEWVWQANEAFVALQAHTSAVAFSTDRAKWQSKSWSHWVASKAYKVNDNVYVESLAQWKRCTVDHTSSAAFATDVAKWSNTTPAGLVQQWAATRFYPVGAYVFDPTSRRSYKCKAAHTSSAAFVTDATSKWTVVSSLAEAPWERICRGEGTSDYRGFVMSLVPILYWLGVPETNAGAGWGDIATAAGVTTMTMQDAEINKESVFTDRPADIAFISSFSDPNTAYVCVKDVAFLWPFKLPDAFVDFVNGGTWADGQLVRDTSTSPPTYWKAKGAHTSSPGSFATIRAGVDKAKWIYSKPRATLDHETGTLKTTGVGTDVNNTSNLVWLLYRVFNACQTYGVFFTFYTNDPDAASGVSENNGVVEANLNTILGLCDLMLAIIDTENSAGGDPIAHVTRVLNRLQFVNGDPLGSQRSNYAPDKVGVAIELAAKGANKSYPVASITVGAGPSYTVHVDAPGHKFGSTSSIEFQSICGAEGLVGKTFYPKNITTSGFDIDKVVSAVNQATGAVTLSTFSGEGLTPYLGGGTVLSQGCDMHVWGAVTRLLNSRGHKDREGWRNNVDLGTFLTDEGAAVPDPPDLAIKSISSSNPTTVEFFDPHPFTTSGAFSRVRLHAVAGMSAVDGGPSGVNGCVFQVANPTTYTIELADFDTTPLLPHVPGTGHATAARQENVWRNLGTQFGYSMPRQFIPTPRPAL